MYLHIIILFPSTLFDLRQAAIKLRYRWSFPKVGLWEIAIFTLQLIDRSLIATRDMNTMLEVKVFVSFLLHLVSVRMLFHDSFWRITKTQIICNVSHVHLAQVEDVAKLLREGLVVTNPWRKCCWRKKNKEINQWSLYIIYLNNI